MKIICMSSTNIKFSVACYMTLHPALLVGLFVCRLVRLLVHHTLLFLFVFCSLWPHCSCPSDQVTLNTAPAHPHGTGLAVYPALLCQKYVSFNPITFDFTIFTVLVIQWNPAIADPLLKVPHQ